MTVGVKQNVTDPCCNAACFGFDFGSPVRVRRVELVLFNCPQWSIRAGFIEIYIYSSTNFPRSDPASVGAIVGSRLFSNGVNSCENLFRVCIQ